MSEPDAGQSCPDSAALETNIPQLRNEMDVANARIYQQTGELRRVHDRLASVENEIFKLQVFLFWTVAHLAVIYIVAVFALFNRRAAAATSFKFGLTVRSCPGVYSGLLVF